MKEEENKFGTLIQHDNTYYCNVDNIYSITEGLDPNQLVYKYTSVSLEPFNPDYVGISIGFNSVKTSELLKDVIYLGNANLYDRRIKRLDRIKETLENFFNYFYGEFREKHKRKRNIKEIPDNIDNKVLITWVGDTNVSIYLYYFSESHNKIYRISINRYNFPCFGLSLNFGNEKSISTNVTIYKWKCVQLNNLDKECIDNFIDFLYSSKIKLYKYK
jgi:hypothetical protein